MHRFTNIKGIKLIKRLEGFRSNPYVCAGGYLTIGYGHRILPSDKYNIITEEKGECILRRDLLRIERCVVKYINIALNDDQFAALVSFTFNCGPAALQRSTLRHKLNYGLLDEASNEFLKWIYAGGRKITGLIRRRKIEQKLFNSYKSD